MENNEYTNLNEVTGTQPAPQEHPQAQPEIFSSAAPQQAPYAAVPQQNPQPTVTPAANTNTQESAYSTVYTAPAHYSEVPQQPQAPQVMNTPYNVYSSSGYTPVSIYTPEPKKKGSGFKKVGAAIGIIALALCVGVGGGFLGSKLAGNPTAPAVTSETSKQSSTPALNIIQSSDTEPAPTTIQEVAAKVKDSVVEITTESTSYDSFYGQYISRAAGSGVIISTDGYIITNNHVIENANTITVRLTNGKSYDAKLIGKDATLDVALLKIEETDLTAATFGDSAKLCVGQTAIAIGNPLGQLGGTVTNGIISALDREIQIDGKTMNLLQTNAAINPGNSGGGLFDANGNLIGIVVAKSSSTSSGTSVEGLGFAIPVNDIMDVLGDLKEKGYVTGRPYLGVNLVDVTSESAMFMYRVDKTGVYVSSVVSGEAAEKAGIRIGDCITKLGDKEVSTSSELKAELSKHKAGETVKITIYRDGEEKTLDVTLGESKTDSTTEESSKSNTDRYGGYGGYGDYDDFFNW